MLVKILKHFKINTLIVSTVFLFSTVTRADLAHRNIPLFQPKRLQLGLEAQSFKSDSNFIEDGTIESLPADFDFTTYDLIFSAQYDLSDEWAASTDLNLTYAESYNGTELRNSREIKDLKLGVYRLYDLKTNGKFIVDGFYNLTFLTNRQNKDEVSASDGVSWLQTGFWWQPADLKTPGQNTKEQYSEIKYDFRTYVGFRTRSSFSDLLILKFHPYFKYKKTLFGVEFNYFHSLIKESINSKIDNISINQSYNASINRFNAWNPDMLEGLFWWGYQPTSYTQFKIGYSQVFGVKNTAQGGGFFFDWQTSMNIDSTGVTFLNFLEKSDSKNPKKNLMKLKNYGKDPNPDPIKPKPSDLEELQ